MKEKLNKELVGLRSSLRSKLEMVTASRVKWAKIVAQKEEDLRRHVMKMPVYEQTSREYDTALDQLKTLDARYRDEIARLRVPRESIEMYDNPLLPTAPYKPDVTLNLAVGAVAGLLLGMGLALLLGIHGYFRQDHGGCGTGSASACSGYHSQKRSHPAFRRFSGAGCASLPYFADEYNSTRRGLRKFPDLCFRQCREGKTTTLCNLAYICAQGGMPP